MHVVLLPLVAALFAFPVLSHAQATGKGNPAGSDISSAAAPLAASALTLEQAVRLAEVANIELQRAIAQRAAAEGELNDARGLLWNNPELSAEKARRTVREDGASTETQRDWAAGVSQTFEIAGQQGYRRKGALQQLDAIDASIEATRAEVRGEVERRFVQVLSLQERIATERLSLKIIEDTALSVKKRVAAGEDSRLDGNLTNVEAVRARNQLGVLEEQLIQARSELAAALQLPPSQLPYVQGTLNAPPPSYTLDALLAKAAQRPVLRALDHREQAAQHRLSLERAARYPDVTVGISTAREGSSSASRERITTLSVSLPLPLFRQNAGNIGRASTELTQAQLERQATLRNTQAELHALWHKLQSLRARTEALQQTVLPALEENQRLSVKSLQAGEISLVQLLLVNRQVLEGKRDLIEAQTELRTTRIALELASGWLDSVPAR